jgi:hypothetical protein
MPDINMTFSVLKVERSSEVNEFKLLKVFIIDVT